MELVEPHLTLLNAKQSTVVTNSKKASVWQDIACQMNGRFPYFTKRTGAQYKEAYRKALSKAKGINASYKKDCVGTGGGPPTTKIDAISMHLIELNKDVPNFSGIDGGVTVDIFPELRKNIDLYTYYIYVNINR